MGRGAALMGTMPGPWYRRWRWGENMVPDDENDGQRCDFARHCHLYDKEEPGGKSGGMRMDS
jgi:hypothetical protein